MHLLALSSPPCTKEFYDRLLKAFPQMEIEPNSEINAIMYNAGQLSVLHWVRHQVQESTITGGPAPNAGA